MEKKIKITTTDFETWGKLPEYALQPWRLGTDDAWITMSCWYYGPGKTVHHVSDFKKSLKTHLEFCAQNDIYIVGWNTIFECAWMIALGLKEEVFKCKWLDGMLLYKNTINKITKKEGKMELSLKDAVRKHIPEHANYEENVDYGAIPGTEAWDNLIHYNKLDCIFTYDLTLKFLEELRNKTKSLKPYLIETACIPMVADSWVNGIELDVPYLHKLKQEKTELINKAWKEIQELDGSITEEMLRSPSQMSDKLFGDEDGQLGLDAPILTKKGNKSTNRLTMKLLREDHPLTGKINDWRENTVSVTKFIDGPLKSIGYYGNNSPAITHPGMRVNSTYSRRMTITSKQGKGKDERPSGIPLHQFPRKKEYRKSIVAPVGHVVVEFDASGQEFRWLAVVSGDNNMLQLCGPRQDAHCYLASQVTGQDYRELYAKHKAGDPDVKRPRDLGKTGNFGLSYGTGAPTFQRMALAMYDVSITLEEAKALHRAYRIAYPGMKEYWSRQKFLTKNQDYIENPFGSRVYFDPNRFPRDEWSYVATSFNFPIQSAGADQKYLALAVLRNILGEYNARFLMDLHDGLYFIVPEDRAALFAARGKRLLHDLPYKRLYNLDLPIEFPWDCKIGPNWCDMKEFEGC